MKVKEKSEKAGLKRDIQKIKKIKSVTVSIVSPTICHEVRGTKEPVDESEREE